ncbi:ATP-binding protein [Thalassobaculum sp.]|uniref:sensor histidine kinase n=1 Tax=Thalassobaculum sp. TaxID=2022740 RepID=UPI0032F03025
MIGRRSIVVALTVAVGVMALSAAVWQITVDAGRARLSRALADKLTVTGRAVLSEVERFRYLPGVLALDPRVTALIDRDGSSDRIEVANRFLTRLRDHAGADELYVLDADGTTLAASNWAEETSFVGRNYRFRSYFKDALAKGEGRFYAVGVTTGKPGYFLASRIATGSGALGVAVVKVDMAPLELAWSRAGERAGVADPAGVIFLTGHLPWKYRLLDPLPDQALANILEARQYDGVRLVATPPLTAGTPYGDEAEAVSDAGGDYLLRRRRIAPEGWQLFATASLAPVLSQARLAALLSTAGALLAAAVVLYLRQRRQIVRMTLDAHAALERRVAERTRELAREVEERRRAEAELRDAQEDLIQAAKLAALGRMSTAIVHEVSQPLAAMETTLASTALLADRGTPDDVKRTVGTARDLVRRMQRTVRHLKSFARRDRGGAGPVDPARAVEAAVELAQHRARDQGLEIAVDTAAVPAVLGHAVRLEQVVLNLLVNALDAVRAAAEPSVRVSLTTADGTVSIAVLDNGSGVDEALRDRITEPFFTTKETGEGLGLGLAISRAIVEDLGGSLDFAGNPGGGSVFTVRLPAVGRIAAAETAAEAAE